MFVPSRVKFSEKLDDVVRGEGKMPAEWHNYAKCEYVRNDFTK